MSPSYDQATFLFGTPEIPEDDPSGFGLTVLSFIGEESISRPYWFRLHLKSRDPKLAFGDVVNQPGRLTIDRGGRKCYIHGIVASFEQGSKDHEWYTYRALIRPRLWSLSLTHRSQVFQHMSVPEIVRTVLEHHGVPHTIELRESYEPREYLVQYNETDLDFISRLLAHEGIRFTFEQGEKRETMLLFDSRGQDPWVEGPTEAPIHEAQGQISHDVSEWVSELYVKEQAVPGKITLKDYNYRQPSADLTTEDQEDDGGAGEVYEYGQHFKDRGEGKRLAKVRKEEMTSQKRLIAGRGNLIGFRAGHRFTLTNHYRDDLNEDYLLVRVRHQGHLPVFAGSESQLDTSEDITEASYNYRNEFGAAPARVSFRTPRLALVENFFSQTFFNAYFDSRTNNAFNVHQGDVVVNVHGGSSPRHGKFYGLMTAPIVGEGKYAPLDEEGRYKVEMPFDQQHAPSRPVRLAQPYGGLGDAGFHFPTHAGNEVVMAYVDGDPDRPLALGIVPNPEHTSPVTSENSSQHIFRTTSGNLFLVEDKEDDENIKLYSPHGKTLIDLGRQKVGLGMKTDLNLSTYSGGASSLHACEGFSFTAWPDGSDGKKVIAKLAPTLGLLSGFWFDYSKAPPTMEMHKPKTFPGKVYQEFKRGAKGAYDFDGFYKTFKTILKIHGQIGTVRGIFSGEDDDETPQQPSVWDKLFSSGPGVSFNSQGGFSVLTADSASIVAAMGVGIKAIGTIDLVSADGVGILAAKDFSVFTHEGDAGIASNKGSVKLESRDSNVFIEGGGIVSVQSKGNLYLAADKKSYVVTSGEEYHLTGNKKVMVTAGDEISLEVGQSKLVMKKDGTITIEGKDITVKATKDITMKGMKKVVDIQTDIETKALNIKTEAKLEHKMSGLTVKSAAKVQNEMEGAMTDVKGKGIASIKGALTKNG